MNEASKEFMEAETIQGMPKSEYDRHMAETADYKPEDALSIEEAMEVLTHAVCEDEVKFLPRKGEIKVKIHDGKYLTIYDVHHMTNGTIEIIVELT